MARGKTTVAVSNIPKTAIASELSDFFESLVGPVYACEISTFHKNWGSRGHGRVQFDSADSAALACRLSDSHRLVFLGSPLTVTPSIEDIVIRPVEVICRLESGKLHIGCQIEERRMEVVEEWGGVRAAVMPERKKLEFWVSEMGGKEYKLEVFFRDIMEGFACGLGGQKENAVLLRLKYAPRIYMRVCGPKVTPKFNKDRYHVCKEELDHTWVRTTDFSPLKSIGQSFSFCFELSEGLNASDIFWSLPHYEEFENLTLTQGKSLYSTSELQPIINCPSQCMLTYKILFQLNALIHSQKLIGSQVNPDLFDSLSGLSEDVAITILLKLHKLKTTCHEPLLFIQSQLERMERQKNLPSASHNTSRENLMSCHRVLVTPSRVYFMGPELETSNYIVKHYAAYESDFLRVSFVDEDWSKLPSDSLSTLVEQGPFSKPHRTRIYNRILSVLRDGITIGQKRFEFLAFSASQLRANSVWMFASNDNVNAESIREWMGNFGKIRSVSMCAARMGQLFSSSLRTLSVPLHEVEIIPDVEVVTDGIKYCFSDGIGKISLSFAEQVAKKCDLTHIPSAFQIRYGGYKGVIAVDRTSSQKLSLRQSMLKFDSNVTMLCVTKWSESLPCYLNREIVCLLSTLGIKDEVFEAMQDKQVRLLDQMLIDRQVALDVLESMVGSDTRTLMKMLLHGYEPCTEPYLSVMLRAYREYGLSDLRSKCRIFVPQGRVLIGCLDESGTLDYGQVYIRVTMTKAELQDRGSSLQLNPDGKTVIVLGKVVVTKNPCLHPGDIRVLDAICDPGLVDAGLVDCIVFPNKGERPHPNECSGGDLDGDLYFASWNEDLIPSETDAPMDYIGRRARLMDHTVTLKEIHKYFVDYMINDTLGAISTAHLVYADREPAKARSPKCLQLANLHSMAVDFAKSGAPAEMPRNLRPREYPDFMERGERFTYRSTGVLGKLYRATIYPTGKKSHEPLWSEEIARSSYDHDLEVQGFEDFLEVADDYKRQYAEKLSFLMNYYGSQSEDEILTGNLRDRSIYLVKDKKRYGEMKDRILIAVKSLHREVEAWFKSSCKEPEFPRMASAWYHVTYHPNYYSSTRFLSFPWIKCDVLLQIKAMRCQK
ncbi:RNA-dependent RNA polymerase 2 [Acorus calamus]|uniref:RNA-dependent RNA polymerase n=1 Tax=Acorus calamus TaxID=4465 RepID=A0AAV9EGD1_ACOCL|nr:RNA-dependent RNA polymerase 2 [Acorus calamus]